MFQVMQFANSLNVKKTGGCIRTIVLTSLYLFANLGEKKI